MSEGARAIQHQQVQVPLLWWVLPLRKSMQQAVRPPTARTRRRQRTLDAQVPLEVFIHLMQRNPHEIGGRQRGQEPEEEPDSHQDSCIYPVEWILEAFHSKRRWWYRVVWLGYPTATWESHEDLEASAGETVLEWMSAARERFQAKFRWPLPP